MPTTVVFSNNYSSTKNDGSKNKTNKKEMKLMIDGDVQISNYKSNDEMPQTGALFVEIGNDGKTEIEQEWPSKSVDLNDDKFNVLQKLASLDGDNANLTLADLENATCKKLGLDSNKFEITKNPVGGVINICQKIGGNLKTWLRIDFLTDKEKNGDIQNTCVDTALYYKFETNILHRKADYRDYTDQVQEFYYQVYGPSLKSKTKKMLDKYNGSSLLGILHQFYKYGAYKELLLSEQYDKYSGAMIPEAKIIQGRMLTDLNKECNMKIKDIAPYINKMFNALPEYYSYPAHELNQDYIKLQEIVNGIDLNSSKKFTSKEIREIEDLFLKFINKRY